MIKIKEIVKKIYKLYIHYTKKVCFKKRVKITISNIYEGYNKLGTDTVFSNSKIGYASYLGDRCKITNASIGKYCSIASNVEIVSGKHPTRVFVSTHPAFYSTKKQAGFTYVKEQLFDEYINTDMYRTHIGNDVWIGANVIINEGVRICDGAIVAAGTVVVKDVKPYSIVGGVPNKLLSYRFSKRQIDNLLNIKWWDKSKEWLYENSYFFQDIDLFLDKMEKCDD